MNQTEMVVPGERLAMEEEFRAGRNTYVEDGVIYAASTGVKEAKDGVMSVVPTTREVKMIDRNMYVIGTVTDDMKSVIFVELDHIDTKNGEFLALKDGKIVLPKPKPSFGGRRDDRRPAPPRQERMCGVGDTIIAKVQYNDKDSYSLSMNEPETGVVYALCELCGSEVTHNPRDNSLTCTACGHRMGKKVSTLYNKPEGIKKLLSQ